MTCDTAGGRPQHGQRFDTLRWVGAGLEMIDQRLLPARVEYRRYEDAAGVAAGIRSMVVRGAPAIGCAAAYGIALAARALQGAAPAQFTAGLEAAFAQLAASRPTAVNLFWALARMRRAWEAAAPQDTAQVAARLLQEAHEITAEDIRINQAMGGHGATLLADGARVLTHCNAGALATAGYGTALGIVRSAVDAGKRVSVFADETRPVLQGARLTAWELIREGVDVTLIADGAAALLMSRGEIDLVVVGADRVAANGDTANKIGTYGLAVVAQRHAVPFYVACPLSTIDLSIRSGSEIPIEERSAEEVTGFGGQRWAPEGIAVRNPAFDVTPAALISALVTERGVVRPVTEAAIRGLFG